MAEPLRYPSCILATAVTPWTEDWRLDERLFRRQVAKLLELEYRHLYIFGTAGEAHAVDDAQFLGVTRVFIDALNGSGVEPMVGVISLSLPTILGRISAVRDLGVRRFQISLPSWGALTTDETRRFFDAVLGRFPDCDFLHYNTPRAKRLVTPDEYAVIAGDHINLVATKNMGDSMLHLRGLLTKAPMVLHFLSETGYVFGSQIGPCGLLVSISTTNAATARAHFAAGQRGDVATMVRYQGELQIMIEKLLAAAADSPRIDSAYDKILWKLHDPEFPLRLLPPYEAARPTAADDFRRFLEATYPHWAPADA
jgi:dihydrodipicolinate synthase/N-acetylneuraminate lyase